jgi:hypothetical protein
MRDWANRIFRRLPAVGQRDCDEVAARIAGTALRNDGKNQEIGGVHRSEFSGSDVVLFPHELDHD